MRSRTSRGVPEWSGGKDLYMGSPVSGIGTSFGVIGIVPGPPEGSRGSTGWGHLSRRAPWAAVGREPALSGLGRPPLGLPLRLGLETLRVGGAPLALGGKPPPWPPPPLRWDLQGGRRPPRTPINSGGEVGQQQHSPWRLPLPLQHLSLPLVLGEALPGSRYFHHHAVVLLDLHQLLPSLAGSRRRRRPRSVRVLNAEVPSVRR